MKTMFEENKRKIKTIRTVFYSVIGVFASLLIAGYIMNLIWLFKLNELYCSAEIIIALIGCIVAPIGAFHGMYLFFI